MAIVKNLLFRSSRPEVFCKKRALKNFAKISQENTCVTFLIKFSLRDFNIDIFTASTVGGKFEALK